MWGLYIGWQSLAFVCCRYYERELRAGLVEQFAAHAQGNMEHEQLIPVLLTFFQFPPDQAPAL
eukprot:725605-Amphidinium_carterae.1